ncbi:hypothetical protein AYI69_g10403 [Smittium culicis]|uniref:Uncharacterized protein n=1 Tax=Smittium culicis TaxID=133412 RepID=A0A1R1X623_9FUNG|nr:hypothetical protein AYI69_g10403 [Smittium culicis]
MSKYDLLPTKFKGDESDLNTVGIWVTMFTLAVSLLKLEGAESLDIFKLWIEGRAAQWQNEVEKLEDTKDWDLAKWTKRLSDYFSKSEKKVGNLITLSKFTKTVQESMSDFNDRFNKYLATIPKEHYTSDWIAKSYLETVSFIDRDLCWLISQDKNANDVKHLMAEASGGSKSQGCVQFGPGNEEANSRIDRVGTHPHLTSENGIRTRHSLPLFIDTGARYSIISNLAAEKLNVPISKLKNVIRISPVKEDPINVREYADVPLRFEDDLVIPTRFININGCAAPVLLGLDVLEKLKVKLNYEKELFTLTYNRNRYNFQLYSEEILNEEFSSEVSEDSSEEDFEEVESGEESDSESNEDCENVPLFYSAVESSIM